MLTSIMIILMKYIQFALTGPLPASIDAPNRSFTLLLDTILSLLIIFLRYIPVRVKQKCRPYHRVTTFLILNMVIPLEVIGWPV